MLFINDNAINFAYFPDGTPMGKVNKVITENLLTAQEITFAWLFDDMSELFKLRCLVDKVKSENHRKNKEVYLYMPYIPNARMDRIKNYEDIFTLKTFATMINEMNFDQVFVKNAHSNVSLALINNVIDIGCEDDIRQIVVTHSLKSNEESEINTIFFPDEGATKRYSDYDYVKKFPIITGIKNRDWKNGQILSLDVIGDVENIKGKNILIIDDISSFGNSFRFSALKLKELGANDIYLYVTHCENSILWKTLRNYGIKKIYTTDSILRDTFPKEKEDNPFKQKFIKILNAPHSRTATSIYCILDSPSLT